MPELPEVETARRTLVELIVDKRIVDFELIKEPGKLVRTLQDVSEVEFRVAVVGEVFTDLRRQGKFLIAPLTSGEVVVFHFMLTGWLDYFAAGNLPGGNAPRHTRLSFGFEDGSRLFFTDSRNLGRVFLAPGERYEKLGILAKMGIEPLGPTFTKELFAELVERSAGKSVKDLLTDQAKIAGIGNIYSDEIMRRAGVRPDRRSGDLKPKEIEALYRAIPGVLEEAIDEIEAGAPGHMLEWRKKGALCPCGGEVAAVKRGASHYYWCPKCQK